MSEKTKEDKNEKEEIVSGFHSDDWRAVEEYLVKKRYAVKDENGKPTESSYDDVIQRVVNWMERRLEEGITNKHFSKYDSQLRKDMGWETPINTRRKAYKHIKNNYLEELKQALLDRIILPATPVLMNAGSPTKHPCYFSCFPLGDVKDSFFTDDGKGIIDFVNLMAAIYRSGGGAGAGMGNIRPAGSPVDNMQGEASGPKSFLDIYDVTTGRISQGGRRRGAFMGYYPLGGSSWKEIATAKLDNVSLTNMNISLTVRDTDISSPDFEEKINLIAECMWKSGEPGLVFIDNHKRVTPVPLRYEPWSMNPCFAGDMRLLTDKGYVKIKDVVNKEVYVWNGEQFTKTIPYVTGENKEVVNITFSNGLGHTVTLEHLYHLKDGKTVQAKDLKVGDVIESFNYPVLTGLRAPNIAKDCFKDGFDFARARVNHYQVISQNCYTRYVAAFISGVLTGGVSDVDKDGNFRLKLHDSDYAITFARLLHCVGVGAGIDLNDEKVVVIHPYYKKALRRAGVNVDMWRLPEGVDRDEKPEITVVDIEKTGQIEDKVYCLTESRRHSVVVDGVLAGQCAEYLSIPFTACNLISVNCIKIAQKCSTFSEYLKELMHYAKLAALFGSFILYNTDGYPKYEIALKTLTHRPVGVGCTGFHESMLKYGFDYTKPDLRMVKLHQISLLLGCEEASAELTFATERPAPCVPSKRAAYLDKANTTINLHARDFLDKDTIKELTNTSKYALKALNKFGGLFNNVTTVQAPTGSVSIFGHVLSTGIEPLYALPVKRRIRETADGDSQKGWKEVILESSFLTPELREKAMKQLAHNVSPQTQLEVLAALQSFCHTSISKTINVPNETTVEDIKKICLKAHKMGLKSFTVYRDGSRNIQVLDKAKKSESASPKKKEVAKPAPSSQTIVDHKLPDVLTSKRFCVRGPVKCYINVSEHNGIPVEVFLNAGKSGTTINSYNEALGRLASLYMRRYKDILGKITKHLMKSADEGLTVKEAVENLKPLVANLDRQAVEEIIHTLSGNDDGHIYVSNGSRFRSLPDALAGILKKCLDDVTAKTQEDTKPEPQQVKMTGSMCPSCGEYTLVRDGSCRKCTNCFYSSC